jgi:hypothetical protein
LGRQKASHWGKLLDLLWAPQLGCQMGLHLVQHLVPHWGLHLVPHWGQHWGHQLEIL